MTFDFGTLQQLAALAANSPASRLGIVRIADTLKSAVGAEQVCFVYAEDYDWQTCGDSQCGDDIGTGMKGLWLVQQQARKQKEPVAFNIRAARVEDLLAAEGATGREYIGIRIPTKESPAEMVIVRGPWQDGFSPSLLSFIEAARPSLIVFLERMLNAARRERQREQISALSNAAEVLTRAEDTQSVLEGLAGAISDSTGYELVTIDLWDEASQSIVARCFNSPRWRNTSVGNSWNQLAIVDAPSLEAIRTRQPVLLPDIQRDPRVTAEARKYFEWIMLASAARIPLLFRDEVLGSVAFASFQPRSFPPEEVEALKGIAAQMVVGLKARRMYAELAESNEQLEKFSKKLQANTEIEHRLARTDALTGIPNRRYVEEVIDAERARALRHGSSLSIGLLDVDKLKSVNDEYGHDAGDEVLMQLAQLARRSCRKGDVVGRYGGDEFLFVLPEADLTAAVRFGERFRGRVEKQPFRLPRGDTLSLNVSLGVAQADCGAKQESPDIIAVADAALYRAKSGGGNAVFSLPAAARVA